MRVLLSNVDVGWMLNGQPLVEDVIIENGQLLPASSDHDVLLNADGLVLSTAFHDHHCHLRARAASASSLRADADVITRPEDFDLLIRSKALETSPGEWIRVTGFHESHCGHLDRTRLDALSDQQPIRVEHASGAMWVVNSVGLAALEAVGMERSLMDLDASGEPTGHLFRADAWIARLPRVPQSASNLGQELLERGVTGLTDATPGFGDRELAEFDAWVGEAEFAQRIICMADAAASYEPIHVSVGPMKVILDDSALPDIERLADSIISIHQCHRNLAVHCVTQVQAVVALSAFELAGVARGDRIEHGAVLDPDLIEWIARLGLHVVTQPGFIAERGDRYIQEAGIEEASKWWPLESLLSAGILVALSSDAPYSTLDPIATIKAASTRKTRSGIVLGDQERIAPWVAARLLGAGALSGEAGENTDWCLLEVGDEAIPERVAWTFMAGRDVLVESR